MLEQSYTASVRGGGANVSYDVGAGFSHRPDFVQPETGQSSPSVYGGLHFARGITTLDVTGRYYVEETGAAFNPALAATGALSYSKPNYARQRLTNETVGLRLGLAPTGWWHHTVTLGIDATGIDDAQTQPRLITPDDTLLSLTLFSSQKASIGYTTAVTAALTPGLSGSLTAGFDHYSHRANDWGGDVANTTGAIQTDPSSPLSADRTITNNTGLFAQAQLGVHDALFLTAGLRAEHNTNFGDSLGTPLSPRLGVSYALPLGGATLKLRGSWGRAIRAPDPGAKIAINEPGYVQLANQVLGPERQQGWDAGVDAVVGGHASLSVTYYDQTANGLIQLVPLDATAAIYQYQNVARVRNTGFELEGAVMAGPVTVKGQYGYTRSRVEDLGPTYSGDLRVGDQVLGTPWHTAGASMSIAPHKGTTLTAGLTFVGSWNNIDPIPALRCFNRTGPCGSSIRDYIAPYPHFARVNATVWQQLAPAVSGFISVDNATNSNANEYTSIYPVRGRTTTLGLKFSH